MNAVTSVTRDDGVVFSVGDRVVLLPMHEYGREHPLNKRAGEEIVIEEFEFSSGIRVPAPERGHVIPYWVWRITALEHTGITDCSISDEDFDSVFDGGANESEKAEGDSE